MAKLSFGWRKTTVEWTNLRWWWWSLSWSFRCGDCSSPRRYRRIETKVEWCQQRKTHDLSTRALQQSYQLSSGSKQEEQGKKMINLALRIIFVHTC
jgi:hypothetical protein